MKTAITKTLILFLFCFSGNYLSAQEVLTDSSIANLHKMGLGPSLIISKIKTCKTNFDVSTTALVQLKSKGIDDEVIAEMMNAEDRDKNNNANPNDPKSPHEAGIYYLESDNMVQLEPSVVSTAKSGSTMLTSMTYGLAQTQNKSVLDGANSKSQLQEKSPVFYFYFDVTKTSLSNQYSFSAATNPKEFILVKFKSNSKRREMVTGSWDPWSGGSNGIDEKYKTPFEFEKVAPGIFKVYFNKDIQPGEYCFIYGGAANGRGNNQVFDFGVEK